MSFSIISALIIVGGLGLIFGLGLGLASKIFRIEKDPRIQKIESVLPGANCGACGAPGCPAFAEGVVEGKYDVTNCVAGGETVAQAIAEIMGIKAESVEPKIAVIQCQGGNKTSEKRAIYQGIEDCTAATLINNADKGCIYGCLGYGSCVAVCPFDALSMGDDGLPVVDEEKCTGCGKCVEACPRGIITLIPKSQEVYLGCISQDFGKAVKSVCKVGCIGCGLCAREKIVENEIITMEGKLPVIHTKKSKDLLNDLEQAVEKCPNSCFVVRVKQEKKKGMRTSGGANDHGRENKGDLKKAS